MFKKTEVLMAEASSLESTGAGSVATEVVTPVETVTPTDNAKESFVDWDKVASEVDGDEVEPTETPAVTPELEPATTPTEPVTPVTPVTPTVPVVPAVTPEVTPTAPVVTPAVVAPVTPVVPVKTDEQIAAEQKAVDETAKAEDEKRFTGLVEYYQLPEDMQLKLSTEPETVLPFLAAKVHQTIAASLVKTMQEILPQAIRGMQEGTAREEKAKEAFYSRWPSLTGKEDAVLQVGMLFRRLNPTATPEEAIERIGKTVSETLGIAVAAAAGTPATPVPAAPAAFTPAGGGGSGRGAAPAADNPFTALADEFLEEDQRPA